MQFVLSATLVGAVGAMVTETKIHTESQANMFHGKSMRMLVAEELEEMFPNSTILLRKKEPFSMDAWDAYKKRHQLVAGDPDFGIGAIAGTMGPNVARNPTEWDGLGGKYLTPGPMEKFVPEIQQKCEAFAPENFKTDAKTNIATPWHNDFLQGWGLTATINIAYGHLVISNQLVTMMGSCSNVKEQAEIYGEFRNACCPTLLKLCCAANTNYEVYKHQLGEHYPYVCQGLTPFPLGQVQMSEEECNAQGNQNWVQKGN